MESWIGECEVYDPVAMLILLRESEWIKIFGLLVVVHRRGLRLKMYMSAQVMASASAEWACSL